MSQAPTTLREELEAIRSELAYGDLHTLHLKIAALNEAALVRVGEIEKHLQTIRDRHTRKGTSEWANACRECQRAPWPCPDYEAAVAALALIGKPTT